MTRWETPPAARRVELWTDGSGRATGGVGGYAFILRAVNTTNGEVLHKRVESGGIPEWVDGNRCTNNRAELIAVLEGLRALKASTTLTIYCDSAYVVDCFIEDWLSGWDDNGWLNRGDAPVANQDLWLALREEARRHAITWTHIPGHARRVVCDTCGWSADVVPAKHRIGPRVTTCPDCETHTKLTAVDKYPLNAECDKLAGAARRALLTDPKVTA